LTGVARPWFTGAVPHCIGGARLEVRPGASASQAAATLEVDQVEQFPAVGRAVTGEVTPSGQDLASR
jgi:hypothetical protein